MPSAGLHVIPLSSNSDRKSLLEDFDGRGTTWIVSDVRSKLTVQRQLLEKNGFSEGLSVLRASELWSFIIKKIEPDIQVVSRELIEASIATRLKNREEMWLRAPGAAKTAGEYIKQLLPIFTAENEVASFDEWFDHEDNSSSKTRWQSWYGIAKDVWLELKRDRLCAASWVAGALVHRRSEIDAVLGRQLIVDLGAELSHVEADLLLEIAKTNRVTVFRPSPVWESDYPEARMAVDWMVDRAKSRGVTVSRGSVAQREVPTEASAAAAVSQASHAAKSSRPTVIYKRLPSGAAEVKEAVARVRQWLDRGLGPSTMAIAAPDIEAYWPVLSLHLEIEGLPTNKSVVSMLHSFSDITRWLARLRIRNGIPEPRDLEVDLFGESRPPLSYASFREVFTRIYEASDLELSDELQKYFADQYKDRGRWNSSDTMNRDVFLGKALGLLRDDDDSSRAVRLFKTVLEECPPDLIFDGPSWAKYLCELAARIEVPVGPSDPFGISCLNLSSLEGIECTHVVVMGLHEGALRSHHGTVIQTSDLRSIEKQTGVVVDGEDRKRVEFEARWVLSQPRVETHLLFADSDLGGTVQTPSWSWMSGAWNEKSKTPEISVAEETRFDELQRRSLENVGSVAQQLRTRRERDPEAAPEFGGGLVTKLSATTIDQVSKCGLSFAFDRILGPRYEGVLDLDADRSRHGRLQHKIFEVLGQTQWRSHTDSELIAVIETAKESVEASDGSKIVRSEPAWLSLRRRLLKTARWLLEFEQAQKRQWPQMTTVGTEVSFKGTVGSKNSQITGQIDRIDTLSGGRQVLIDYKNRAAAPDFNHWRKRNFWQPLVYAYALKKNWINDDRIDRSADLAAIFIYDIKKRSKGKGLRLRSGNEDLFEFKKPSDGQSVEDLEEAFQDLESTIALVSAKLENGEFYPEPADSKDCLRCRWRLSCRAPHLELL